MSNLRPHDNAQALSKHGSVIVVGIVRDIEKSFNRDFQRINESLRNFSGIEWHLVESGSTDASEAVLDQYAKTYENFSFQHLVHEKTISRTENMANARNAYLNYLRTDSRLEKYDYVIMADFNNLNNKLNAGAVETIFKNDSWDVVTANQSGRYYDAWALRHPLWSPNDCWEQHAFFRKYSKFPESAITFSMRPRMLKIPANSEWIEVDSAFGGLAIYKSSVLKSNATYVGVTSEGKRVCEHVPFHSVLKSQGARIFINPALINTRITDHSRRISSLFTFLRMCRYPLNLLLRNGKNV